MTTKRRGLRDAKHGTPVTMRTGEPGTIIAVQDRCGRVRALVHPGDVRPMQDVDPRDADWHLVEHLTRR